MTSSDRILAGALRLLPHLLILLALLALWELAFARAWINTFLIPPPSRMVGSLVRLYVTEGTIWRHFGVTMFEAVAGFLIGATAGAGLAVASALSEPFRRYVSPYAVVLNVTPGLALTPLVIAWFGFDWGSKVALAAIICFFEMACAISGYMSRVNPFNQPGVEEYKKNMFRMLGKPGAK